LPAWRIRFRCAACESGERVVDVGSGAGFDCFVAARQVGAKGAVIGVDMTAEMLAKSRATAKDLGLANVEFREGLVEQMPVEDGWADAVISNGVINLCPTSARFSPRFIACCGPVAGCSLPTSPTERRCPRRRGPMSISGRLELPVVCRVQPGRSC
jgi:SAM-dependent methyltransferase